MKLLKVAGAVLGVVLVVAGAALAVSWAPDRPVESLTARWAPPPSQFIDVDGMQAHVRDEGPRNDPEPIVLLHGTSASLHTWDGWVQALKVSHRVIRMDLPGFGLTGPTPDGRYDMATYMHFLNSLLDKLDVKQAVIGGNSFGGYVAWKMAADYPKRVSKLILVDAGGYNYKAQSVPLAFKLAQIPELKPFMANLLPRAMIETSVRNVYGDPSKVTPELIDRYYELTLRAGNREALTARFSQSKGGEFEGQIAQIRQPTLIIWGGKDHLIPPDNADRFQHDIAGSRLAMFDQLGHVPQEEDPASTVAAVLIFLHQ